MANLLSIRTVRSSPAADSLLDLLRRVVSSGGAIEVGGTTLSPEDGKMLLSVLHYTLSPPQLLVPISDLRDAVLKYQQAMSDLAPAWEFPTSNAEVELLVDKERALAEELQEAFYQATQDRNSRSHVSGVPPSFIRTLVNQTINAALERV